MPQGWPKLTVDVDITKTKYGLSKNRAILKEGRNHDCRDGEREPPPCYQLLLICVNSLFIDFPTKWDALCWLITSYLHLCIMTEEFGKNPC